MSDATIICCAVTGAGDTPGRNPAVPVTPAEIAQSSLDAAAAGAAMVHLHVRDPETGKPSMDLALYKEAVDRIRDANAEVIINLTTGPGARFVPAENPRESAPGTTLRPWRDRLAHIGALRPDVCSLDIASMNYGDYVIVNSPPHLREMAAFAREIGVLPELEVFDVGQLRLALNMLEKGELSPPGMFQFCLGTSWGAPASPEAMLLMRGLLPPDALWFAFGVGPQEFPMAALSCASGGHVRVGLEDNLYLGRGTLAPSNAALVERAARLIADIGRPVATPSEARQLLGLGQARP